MAETVTESRIIEVAIDLFGRGGPDAVTTREIAEAAGAQQSAISYHFRSKDRLYIACAEHIADFIGKRTIPLVAGLSAAADPNAARAQVEALVSGLVSIMMNEEIAPLARFVVREQMNPTPAFEVLYDRAMQHIVETLARLLSIVAGDRLNTEELRVRCVALLGQVFAFRYAHAALMRVTEWESVGPRETELVRQTVIAHTRAIIDDLERERPS